MLVLAGDLFPYKVRTARMGGSVLLVAVAIVAFAVREGRVNNSVIPQRVRNNSLIIIVAMIGFLCTMVFYSTVFILSLYLQQKMAITPSQVGIFFLHMKLSVAIVTYGSVALTEQN